MLRRLFKSKVVQFIPAAGNTSGSSFLCWQTIVHATSISFTSCSIVPPSSALDLVLLGHRLGPLIFLLDGLVLGLLRALGVDLGLQHLLGLLLLGQKLLLGLLGRPLLPLDLLLLGQQPLHLLLLGRPLGLGGDAGLLLLVLFDLGLELLDDRLVKLLFVLGPLFGVLDLHKQNVRTYDVCKIK